MFCNCVQQLPRRIVEQKQLPLLRGITGLLLPEHLNHHIVGRFVDKRDHNLLPVDQEPSLCILRRRRLGHLPDKIPGQRLRQLKPQGFNEGFINIAGLRGSHIRNRVIMPVKGAFLQKLRDDLLLPRGIKENPAPAESVLFVRKQLLQRNHEILPGYISCNMVGIGNADIRRRVSCNVCDNIIINSAVIRIKTQVYAYIWVELLKISNRLLIDFGLRPVGIVLCPEGQLVLFAGIKVLWDLKLSQPFPAVTAGKKKRRADEKNRRKQTVRLRRCPPSRRPFQPGRHPAQPRSCSAFHITFHFSAAVPAHPFVPPLDTPSIIFFRNARNRTISGTEITTTAAIIAGTFSRPKPFSRIS